MPPAGFHGPRHVRCLAQHHHGMRPQQCPHPTSGGLLVVHDHTGPFRTHARLPMADILGTMTRTRTWPRPASTSNAWRSP